MKLLLLAYVASAASSEQCQEQSHTHSPHLHKRDWADGDRHCSYRESVVFESLSREFDRLVGPEPKATALITGDAMALSAHEGAVFLEHGAEGEAAASLLFTTKPYEHTDGKTGRATPVADGFARPNGLAFSPDERTLYVTDSGFATGRGHEMDVSAPRRVEAFTVVKKRILTNRRLLHVADTGIPDGIKVDARGRLYVGCGDGVHVLSRDGELLGKIKLPGKDPAANLAFGKGKHRSTLYVLDETSVTAVELPGTRGARVGRERKFDVGRVRYKST